MRLEHFDLRRALKSTPLVGYWEKIDDSDLQVVLNNELQKELDVGHELHGCTLNAIMRNMYDVLYQFAGSEKVADVHLTFCASKDIPPFPLSSIYDGLDEWFDDVYFSILPESLTHFGEIVLGYAIGLVSGIDFEHYIYHSPRDDVPLDEGQYLELISADFTNETAIVDILNRWYTKAVDENYNLWWWRSR